jgi:flavin-dependent dehydrogenase
MGDVLVVGASLAGSTAAALLARKGHHVTLIDQTEFPRRKACGEGIFHRGVRVLEESGVLTELQPVAGTINSLTMTGYGATATAHFSPTAAGIGARRELLDAALLQRARASGVNVQLGVTAAGLVPDAHLDGRFAAVKTSQGDLRADVIVAADGLGSRLRRTAGLHRTQSGRRRYGASAHFEVATPPEGVEVCFRRGYEVYVTPTGGAQVKLAVLLSAGMARAFAGRLTAAFDDLAMESTPLLQGARRSDDALFAGPFPGCVARRWRGNLLLAGDAAGFFDGITGEGMSLALDGAGRCAQAVDAFLVDGQTEHFASYDRQIARMQRPSSITARLCLALAGKPALGRIAINNLSRKPEVFTRLIRVSQGELALSALRPNDALALLFGV